MQEKPLTQQQRYEFYDQAKDVVMVDFDGTICKWSYPDMGEPEMGARHFMKGLARRGLRARVWSCRLSPEFNTEEEIAEQITRIAQWMSKWDIPYDSIDTGQNGKALCLAYVDDRGAQYTGNWHAVMRRIDNLVEIEKQQQDHRRRTPT